MNDEKNTWLDRTPIPALPWLTIEVLVFAVIILLALFTRFYDLGTRVMSHDESLHTYYSWTLSQGQGYQHNPMMHGPLQFHLIALTYFLFGANDFTARIPAVLFSIATVWALWYWRRYLGRAGVIAAGIMMVLSPYMLYYGRYVRNEAYVGLFGVLTLYAVLRYLETGLPKYMYLLVAAIVLHFTAKETAFIYAALLLVFLAGYLIARITQRPWPNVAKEFKVFGLSIIVGILALGGALLIERGKVKPVLNPEETISPAVPGEGLSPLAPIDSGLSLTLTLGIVGVLAFGVAIYLAIRGYGLINIRQERAFDLAMAVGTLILPMLSPLVMEWISPYTQAWFDIPVAVPIDAGSLNVFTIKSIILMIIILLVFVGLAVALGLFWNKRLWWKLSLLFYSIFTVFYTTLFTNGGGFFTGLLGSLGYWIEQHGVERGSQPLYYYVLIQVPFYEYLPALAAIFALVIGARRLRQAREQTDEVSVNLPNTYALLGWWSISSLVAFSIAGERMPWLTLHITLPLILFGGWGIGSVIERIDWQGLRRYKAALTLTLVALFVFSILGMAVSLASSPLPFEGMELGQLETTTTFLLAMLGMVGSGYGLYRLLEKWDVKQAAYLAILVFFGIFAILTARTTIRANYVNYDSGQEYLVYAHSYTGNKQVLKDVQELSIRTTGGPYDIVVAYDDAVSWPLSWYMINFPNARFYGSSPDMSLRDAPAIIVGDKNFTKVEPIVGEDYYRFDYVRMVWPNQDYFHLVSNRFDPNAPFPEGYCPGVLGVFKLNKNKDYSRICDALSNPEMLAAIFDIWLNRDYSDYARLTGRNTFVDTNWDPSDRMRLYIRKDVADLVWNYGIKIADLQPDPYAEGMLTLTAEAVFGTPGSEAGQFNAPRGLAFAPDGSLYVADSRNNRIQHFTAEGEFINAFGTFGDLSSGEAPPGSLNEPWGVAVGPDGNVYVTDTWNHRVQKFSADGKPLTAWGVFGLADDVPNVLYGPRGIAVDAKGRIFVADTGNKRIIIYNANGDVLNTFGASGYEAGQFNEPVDVKLDAKGNVYVTDTWNLRVQVFSPLEDGLTYIPVAQWPVHGWRSQNLENKPFIAIAQDGMVFVTDPENYRVIQFTSTGEFVQLWGTYGEGLENFGLASGIAIDKEGRVWVTDSGNGRIMRFSLP